MLGLYNSYFSTLPRDTTYENIVAQPKEIWHHLNDKRPIAKTAKVARALPSKKFNQVMRTDFNRMPNDNIPMSSAHVGFYKHPDSMPTQPRLNDGRVQSYIPLSIGGYNADVDITTTPIGIPTSANFSRTEEKLLHTIPQTT